MLFLFSQTEVTSEAVARKSSIFAKPRASAVPGVLCSDVKPTNCFPVMTEDVPNFVALNSDRLSHSH